MSLRVHTLAPMLAAGALLVVQPSEALARVKPPLPAPTTVNCTAGQSINAAIANGFTVITVRGQCNEEVEIAVDNIWLLSHPSVPGSIQSSVEAPLTILGADGIIVDGLTIEAQGGVTVAVFIEHSSVHMQDVDVIGGTQVGLEARRNASVTFNDGSISGAGTGAIVTLTSNLSVNGSTVSNVGNGMSASRGAFLQVQGTDVTGVPSSGTGVGVITGAAAEITAGSTVSGFAQQGVVAIGGDVTILGSTISGNGFSGAAPSYPAPGGVLIASGSSLVLGQSSTVSGNVNPPFNDAYGVGLFDGSGGNCFASNITGNSMNLFVSPGSEFGSGAICVVP